MLEVTLGRVEATLALPIVRTDLPDDDRLRSLASLARARTPIVSATLSDLIEDKDETWRSPWLQACAAYASERPSG